MNYRDMSEDVSAMRLRRRLNGRTGWATPHYPRQKVTENDGDGPNHSCGECDEL